MLKRGGGVAVALAAVVALGGCASKGWVQQYFGKKEAQIDQRIGKVETQAAQDGQRITGVETQVGNVDSQIGKVQTQVSDQGARMGGLEKSVADAGDTAKGAMAKADGVDARVTRLWNGRYKRNVVDTITVPFGVGKSDLTDGAQTALLGVVRELQANGTLSVQLEGYTDGTGSREYNYTLSERRVESVRRFLVRQGVELERIQSVALGPVQERGVPDRDKRRVVVKLLTDID